MRLTNLLRQCAITLLAFMVSSSAAQQGVAFKHGVYTDPISGIQYERTWETRQEPVVETRMRQEDRVIYRPETTTQMKSELQTVHQATTRNALVPTWTGWWNPFRQPTLVYQNVPVTTWQTRTESVSRPVKTTTWVREKTKVSIPERVVRMEQRQVAVDRPVGSSSSVPRFAKRGMNQTGMPATVLGSSSAGATRMATRTELNSRWR